MEEILAPCGYRCDLCPVYYKNIANIDKQKLSDGYLKYFNSQISSEEIKSCKGCFDEGEKDCLVRSCVFNKRIDNCAQCPDFGCDKLKTKMNVIEDNIKDVSSLSEEDYNLFVRSYASKERLSKMNNKITTIKNSLKQLSNKQLAEHSQKYFKTGKGEYGEGDKFLGIRVPILRKLAREHKEISIKETVQLLKSQIHEERLLSLFILINLYQKSNTQGKKEIYDLYLSNTRFINNWDLVDSSAPYIVGAYLWEINKTLIYILAKSKNLWERRIAIISTFYFIKQNDFHDALKISKILLYDTEDLIHKAVGWMLREIGKRDISAEEDFLKKHYKNMPRTMLRYAIEKFPNAKRKCYLKNKI